MTNYAVVYADGVYPHYEFRNPTNASNCRVVMDDVVSRVLRDFEAPWE